MAALTADRTGCQRSSPPPVLSWAIPCPAVAQQRHDASARTQTGPYGGLLENIRHRISRVLGRAIPCSQLAQQRHNIIRKAVALAGEESVSGVTGTTAG